MVHQGSMLSPFLSAAIYDDVTEMIRNSMVNELLHLLI